MQVGVVRAHGQHGIRLLVTALAEHAGDEEEVDRGEHDVHRHHRPHLDDGVEHDEDQARDGVEDPQAQDARPEQGEHQQRGPEPTERVDPAHRSAQPETHGDTRRDGRLAGFDRHPARLHGRHARSAASGAAWSPVLGDPEGMAWVASGEVGVLLGDGTGVLEGRGPRPLQQARGPPPRGVTLSRPKASPAAPATRERSPTRSRSSTSRRTSGARCSRRPRGPRGPSGSTRPCPSCAGRAPPPWSAAAWSAAVTRSAAAASAPATSGASHWTRTSVTTTSGTAPAIRFR